VGSEQTRSLLHRKISKRYSEFVTLDRKLRKGGGGLTIGESDAMLPKLLDKSTVGKNAEEVVAERRRELEEWLQLATLHPLVSVSAQLHGFLGQDVINPKLIAGGDPAKCLVREPGGREGSSPCIVEALGEHDEDKHAHFINHLFTIPVSAHDLQRQDTLLASDPAGSSSLLLSKRYSEVLALDESAAFKGEEPPTFALLWGGGQSAWWKKPLLTPFAAARITARFLHGRRTPSALEIRHGWQIIRRQGRAWRGDCNMAARSRIHRERAALPIVGSVDSVQQPAPVDRNKGSKAGGARPQIVSGE
jgi:hypothetical protein